MVSEKKIFFNDFPIVYLWKVWGVMVSEKILFPIVSLWELMTLDSSQFGPQGHDWQYLCRLPLNIATN